jgi:AraC-like DNA-binding protein
MKLDLRKHLFQFISFVDVYHSKAAGGSLNINDDHHAMHIIKGNGQVTIDKTTFPISNGNVITIGPFQEFNFDIEPGFAMRNIHYRLWSANGEPMEQRWMLPYVFTPDYFAHTEKLLKLILSLSKDPVGNIAQLTASAHELILEHWSKTPLQPSRPVNIDKRIETVYKVLTSNNYTDYQAQELAEESCLSVSQMNRLFKKYFKKSPQKFWEEKRLSSICIELKNSDCSIRQIAEECGFDDPAYFSRWFKKRAGSSPIEYRNNLAQGNNL